MYAAPICPPDTINGKSDDLYARVTSEFQNLSLKGIANHPYGEKFFEDGRALGAKGAKVDVRYYRGIKDKISWAVSQITGGIGRLLPPVTTSSRSELTAYLNLESELLEYLKSASVEGEYGNVVANSLDNRFFPVREYVRLLTEHFKTDPTRVNRLKIALFKKAIEISPQVRGLIPREDWPLYYQALRLYEPERREREARKQAERQAALATVTPS